MSVKYKIYDDGMLKQIDVIDTSSSEVIGNSTYHPQELMAEVSGSDLVVKDDYSRAVKFKAAYTSFVDLNDNTWGETLQGAATTLNAFLQQIPIKLGDLENIDQDSGGLTVNLEDYALTTYVDTEISSSEASTITYSDEEDDKLQAQIDALTTAVANLTSQIEVIEGEIDVRPAVLFQGDPFTFSDTDATFTAPSAGQMSFTTTDSGKVHIVLESINIVVNQQQLTSYGKTWLYISSTNPSFFNYKFNVDSDPNYDYPEDRFRDWVDDGTIVLAKEDETPFGNVIGTNAEPADFVKSITIQLNLTPNTTYTFWLYDVPITVGSGVTCTFKIQNGIRVVEVLDI